MTAIVFAAALMRQLPGAFVTSNQHGELLSNAVERLVLRPVTIGSWTAVNGLARLHRGQVTSMPFTFCSYC
ncbi:MAG: hypothetical protein J5I81_01775 [Nitrococcus mobilis]|nr:hypothetical protein [Nitrococcus mobilis]